MNRINSVKKTEETEVLASEQNRFEVCEEVVSALVEEGLPQFYSPSDFISKLARDYNISAQEARTCLKLAIKQLESQKEQEEKQDEERYAQCGYYYPSAAQLNKNTTKNSSMDSLSQFGNYNRMMFGLS